MNVAEAKNLADGMPVAPALVAYVSQASQLFNNPAVGEKRGYTRRSIKIQDPTGEISVSVFDEPFEVRVGQQVQICARAGQGKSQLSGATKGSYQGAPQIKVSGDRLGMAQSYSAPAGTYQPPPPPPGYVAPPSQPSDPAWAQGASAGAGPGAPSWTPPKAKQPLTEATARRVLLRNAESFLRAFLPANVGPEGTPIMEIPLDGLVRHLQPEVLAMVQAWASGILIGVQRGDIQMDDRWPD
jgi:hypothetical protein